jgi:flagellar hook-length control protein FliK
VPAPPAPATAPVDLLPGSPERTGAPEPVGPATRAEAVPVDTVVDGTPTGAVAAPPAPAAAVTPAGPPTAAPAPADPPVAAQLAPQITLLASTDGSHSVTMVLAPESLGEVHVHLTVTGDQVTLALAAGHEGSRAALVDAVPELRRELAAAGLTLTDAQVSADAGPTSGGSNGSGWSQGTDPRSAPMTRWGQVPTGPATADDDSSTTSTTRHARGGATSTGVDVRV